MTEASFDAMINILGTQKESTYMNEISCAFQDVANEIGDVPVLDINSYEKHSIDPYIVQTGTWFSSTTAPKIDKSKLYF